MSQSAARIVDGDRKPTTGDDDPSPVLKMVEVFFSSLAAQTQAQLLFLLTTLVILGYVGRSILREIGRLENTTTPTKKVSKTIEEEAPLEASAVEVSKPLARSTVIVTVNGVTYRLEDVSPRTTLLWWLRNEMNLTGTKIGCGEGGCGACTVIEDGKHAINSCLRLLVACDGKTIDTIEYQGSSRTGYSEEQLAIASGNGTQCGYCTPGWTQAMRGLNLQYDHKLSAKDIEEKLDGNICRCTGTMPIVKAFKRAFTTDLEDLAETDCHDTTTGAKCGRDCDKAVCEKTEANVKCCSSDEGQSVGKTTKLAYTEEEDDEGLLPPRTPNELVVYDKERDITYIAPTTLQELFHYYDTIPTATLVGGSTACIGVSKYYWDALYPWKGGLAPTKDATFIATKTVPELTYIETTPTSFSFGSGVTISDVILTLEPYTENPKIFAAVRHMKRVANTQVRNSGTWAGNLLLLANAPQFISDLIIGLTVADATIAVSEKVGFLGPRTTKYYSPFELVMGLRKKTINLKSAVVLKATIPYSSTPEPVIVYVDKVSARHSNAHAIVNCGLTMYLNGKTITKVSAYFGGLFDPNYFEATKLEQAIYGKSVDDPATLEAAIYAVRYSAYDPTSYEADLAVGFVFKWFLKAKLETEKLNPIVDLKLANYIQSLAVDRPVTMSTANIIGASDILRAPANTPMIKQLAFLQASGEATYCTDLPLANNEVYCHFAWEQCAGKLTSVNVQAAYRIPGVVMVLTAEDLIKQYGAVPTLGDPDDLLLYGCGDCVFVGARVAIAVATTYEGAIEAARAVCTVVEGEPFLPIYYDPTDAIADHYADRGHGDASSIKGKWRRIGLPREGLKVIDNRDICLEYKNPDAPEEIEKDILGIMTVTGAVHNDTQKHFTLETHACRVLPVEDDVLEVWSSSQNNALAQTVIAMGLKKPEHKVIVKVKRIGGGFGSKLSLHLAVATMTSIVADITQRPSRCHAERRDDMHMTGGREPCCSKYAITANARTMKLLTYTVDFDLHSGVASGDGAGDLGMAVAWSDNCYKAQVLHYATGRALKTPAPRNTSMRSPGVLQSHATHEVAMVHLAHALKKPAHEVQEANFYNYGDMTPYGYTLGENGFNWTIPELWAKLKPKYLLKKAECDAFNATSLYKKRGVHMSPTKYVIGLADWKIPSFVVIYSDGTVLVTTGGNEIGQGLYTKVAQTAAFVLGCDLSYIRVGDTTTDKNPNATGTGGSGTSESACNAAILACEQLKAKLGPYLDNPVNKTWADACMAATNAQVDLRATALNNVPYTAQRFDYATYGVGLAQVEVDVLTGEVSILDVDVAMDQGTSLNAEIDLGQLQGGYIIALGFYFTEKNDVSPDGTQTADGTWEYKPPMVSDLPLKMHCSMLPLTPNPSPVAVLNSKASGEPPMQLASSAFLAAHYAIRAARKQFANNDEWFDLPIPATPMDIRQACCLSDANLKAL